MIQMTTEIEIEIESEVSSAETKSFALVLIDSELFHYQQIRVTMSRLRRFNFAILVRRPDSEKSKASCDPISANSHFYRLYLTLSSDFDFSGFEPSQLHSLTKDECNQASVLLHLYWSHSNAKRETKRRV